MKRMMVTNIEIELPGAVLKIKDGKSLTISIDDAKQLRDELNVLFPSEVSAQYPLPLPTGSEYEPEAHSGFNPLDRIFDPARKANLTGWSIADLYPEVDIPEGFKVRNDDEMIADMVNEAWPELDISDTKIVV
jgi:hypothetical protein|tara:strand:+ start:622 stop:1020 length:399 start_codon:yes stop_codon:yes gene_type:complete